MSLEYLLLSIACIHSELVGLVDTLAEHTCD